MSASLTDLERVQIADLLERGMRNWEIARASGRSTKTIAHLREGTPWPLKTRRGRPRSAAHVIVRDRETEPEIPASSILGQLETCAACWPDVIEEGPAAIERAVSWLAGLLVPVEPDGMRSLAQSDLGIELASALRSFRSGDLAAPALGARLDWLAREARLVPQARRAS